MRLAVRGRMLDKEEGKVQEFGKRLRKPVTDILHASCGSVFQDDKRLPGTGVDSSRFEQVAWGEVLGRRR
jgi:hypothetical protein